MGNLEKYNKIFVDVLDANQEQLNDSFSVENTEKWDSIAHITLIGEIEDAFDIMLDAEDIISFSSYKGGIEILAKYDVEM